MTVQDPRRISALALIFGLIFIISLCWPMLVSGQLLAFYDTRSYLRGGEKIWEVLFDLLATAAPQTDAPGAAATGAGAPEELTVNAEGKNVTGRSFPYSAFAFLAYSLGGPIGIALSQAALVTTMLAVFVTPLARQSPWVLVAGAAFLTAVSGLPWYASFLMPDIFGGLVVLFGVFLVRDIDRLGFWATVLVLALAAFAATAHYGNIPLMAGVVVSALAIRLLRRRFSWKSLVVGLIALMAAPIVNLGASAVVLDEASVAPKRIPVLLTRSLDDGPALWYLQDVCPEADLGLCIAYGDNITADTGEFLWSDTGVMSLPPELLDRIRDEEFQVVMAAAMRYPVAQLNSFFGHSIHQLFRVGVEEIAVADRMDANFEPFITHAGPAKDLQDLFDKIIPLATFGSAIALVAVALGFGLTPRWVDMIAIYMIGYGGNAFIYGGLSAPIDRYQGRTAWLIPVLLFVLVAEIMAERRRQTSGQLSRA